jgi:hypothetical protein
MYTINKKYIWVKEMIVVRWFATANDSKSPVYQYLKKKKLFWEIPITVNRPTLCTFFFHYFRAANLL